jgi:hypothetical protein
LEDDMATPTHIPSFAPEKKEPEEPKEPGILSSIAGVALSAAQAKFAAPSNSPPMSSFEKVGGISGRK